MGLTLSIAHYLSTYTHPVCITENTPLSGLLEVNRGNIQYNRKFETEVEGDEAYWKSELLHLKAEKLLECHDHRRIHDI